MNKVRLGLLELGERSNTNSQESIFDIIEYAVKAEEFGFTRFWLAEHHADDFLIPYTAPELMISVIAGSTSSIKVGSAGSIINYYSPYSLVTQYKFLNNLFFDRIDFGLSKGHNINKHLKHDYLNLDRTADHHALFDQNIKKIHDLLYNEQLNHQRYEIVIPPYSGAAPALWYLSSSYRHLEVALEHRLNYCRSLFHGYELYGRDHELDKLRKFRKDFMQKHQSSPIVSIAIGISVDEGAELHGFFWYKGMYVLKGSLRHLCALISHYADTYAIDEIIIYDIETDNRKKISNIEMISKSFYA